MTSTRVISICLSLTEDCNNEILGNLHEQSMIYYPKDCKPDSNKPIVREVYLTNRYAMHGIDTLYSGMPDSITFENPQQIEQFEKALLENNKQNAFNILRNLSQKNKQISHFVEGLHTKSIIKLQSHM